MAQYTNPLRLVTPHMKGDRVKDAQYLMKGNNPFSGLATYKDGELDGDYGVLTAQATKRAKYWLGYPNSEIDTSFGQKIYEFLNGKKQLPKDYKARRAERIRTFALQETRGLRAYKEALKHLGYKEEPRHGVNDNMFGRWYGWNWVAWCAIFESYCFARTGWPAFRYAAVERIYADAVANQKGMFVIRSPRQGDIVGYRIGGDPFAHTAFFDHWVDSDTFVDLGGNTGPTNISNGGMVLQQQRSTSMVRYYVRVT